MIWIYSPDNTDFDYNGDMALFPESAEVHVILGSTWEAVITHPIDDEGRWTYIVTDAVVKMPSFNGEQLWRIKEVVSTDNGIEATCQPIFYDAAGDVFLTDVRPTEKTGQEALDILMEDTQYSGESDIETPYTAYYQYVNLLEALNGDIDQAFVNRWGGEIIYDNYTVIINSQAGEDNGVEIRYGKNIPEDGFSVTEDMSDVVTRIYPKGFDGVTMTDDGYVDSDRIDDYPAVHAATITFDYIYYTADMDEDEIAELEEDEENVLCETQDELDEALKEACEAEFEDGIDLPAVTISADMILLADTVQYKDVEVLETVSLGDTVHVINSHLGFETEARVIELTYDSLLEKITSVVLGDYEYDYFSESSKTAEEALSTVNELTASVGEFKTVITAELYATNASITNLEAVALTTTSAHISELYTDVALIEELYASVANVNTLLSGAVGTGTLEAIYLTSSNVVIEDALITDAMIASLSASKITSGKIYTSLVTIQTSEDSETLYISDSMLQIRDESNMTRIQLGLDGEGNYNYYVFGEDGSILFDALGIYGEGIHEGVIVNDHISDTSSTYSGISGSKLDIDSVITSINEDGTVSIEGASVTIDGSTLDYKLTTLTTAVSESLTGYTAYYCLWYSAEETPPNYDETSAGAYLDISAYLDEFELDDMGNSLWTETYTAPSEGYYVWRTYVITTADGTTTLGEPALISGDPEARETTETLTTELTVVQGEISALVEYTEIETWEEEGTTIYQAYSALTLTVDEIKSEVTEVTTSVSDLETTVTTKISSFEQTVAGLEAEISAIESLSGENISEVLEQIATLSATVSGFSATVSDISSTVSSLEDDYTELSSDVSELTLTASSLTSSISSLQSTVDDNNTSLQSSISTLEQTAEALSSTISTVSDYATANYGTCSTSASTSTKVVKCSDFVLYDGAVINVYFTYANTASSPTLNVNSTGAKSIRAYSSSLSSSSDYNWTASSVVTFVYDGSYWRIADSSSMSKIVQTADSLTVDIEDLQSNARTYFQADATSITVSSGVVTFSSNTFAVDSTYFTLTKTGVLTCTSATITGTVTSVSGSVYAVLQSGRLLMYYGDSTTVTAYVSGYEYYSSTGVHGLRMAGKGCIALYTPYFGIGSWTTYGTDGTITLGQSGTFSDIMTDFDVTWTTTYIYLDSSGNLGISTSKPSSYSSYVSFSRATNFSWTEKDLTFTKGLMTTSI